MALCIAWAGFAAASCRGCDGVRTGAPREENRSPIVMPAPRVSLDGGARKQGPPQTDVRRQLPRSVGVSQYVDRAVLEDGKRVLGKRLLRFCEMWHEELYFRYSRLTKKGKVHPTRIELRVKHEGNLYETVAVAHKLAKALGGTIISEPPDDEFDGWEWKEYRQELSMVRDIYLRQRREDGVALEESDIWYRQQKGARNRVVEEVFLYWACGGGRFVVQLKTRSPKERDQVIAHLRTDPRVFAVGPTWVGAKYGWERGHPNIW